MYGAYRGAEKSATRGCAERLGLHLWSEGLEGRDHASLASELAPIWGGCCLADCHSLRRLRPISRFFPRPSLRRQGEPRSSVRSHPDTLQKTAPSHARKREPEGRSPARSAGKAKRRACRAREDYGWGWAGGVIKPTHAPNPTPRPQAPAAAAAAAAVPVPVPVTVTVSASVSVPASGVSEDPLQLVVAPLEEEGDG